MITQPQAAAPQTDAERNAQDALYYRDVVHELIEMGADFARDVHHARPDPDYAAPSAAQKIEGLSIAFDRLARTVRRCIMLARKVAEPVPVRAAPVEGRAARQQIIGTAEDSIQRRAGDSNIDAETLKAELDERLDGPEFEDNLWVRPVAEFIAEICRDLGVHSVPGDTAWKRRTPGDLAILHARAAAPCKASRARTEIACSSSVQASAKPRVPPAQRL